MFLCILNDTVLSVNDTVLRIDCPDWLEERG
jgi:hypothetical protein